MSRLITAADRITRARALIQKARDLPLPSDSDVMVDLAYAADVKDILRQARDLIKFINYTPTATPEVKNEVRQLFADADLAERELLHR
jgi:hypothetical protein